MIGEIKILKTCDYNHEPRVVLITRKSTIKNTEDEKVDCYMGIVINEGLFERPFLEKDLIDFTIVKYVSMVLEHDTESIQKQANSLKDTAQHLNKILRKKTS